MGDELTVGRMIGMIFFMMIMLSTLPVMLDSVQVITGNNETRVSESEPFRFPNLNITNPIHRGIIDNIWTGILLMLLTFVSAGCVYAIRFLYEQIRTGKIDDDEI